MKHLIWIALITGVIQARAETATLKMASDLMIHPSQIANFFHIATNQIQSSPNWNWAQLQFAKPYKTQWSDVEAKGPFQINFDTSALAQQTLGFELVWNDPAVTVGRFDINDTIQRSVGGANIIIHLAGHCTGMSMAFPNGQWKVQGHLVWTWNNGTPSAQWSDFQFSMNSTSVAQANVGECAGPTGLPIELKQAFDMIAADQTWLSEILKQGVQDWLTQSLTSLQNQLLLPRQITLKPGIDLQWKPESLVSLQKGIVRVPGSLVVERSGVSSQNVSVDRSYSDSALGQVKSSGFMLPKNTIQSLFGFLYSTGDLQYRAKSSDISGFKTLEQSRFLQFFLWPDLMQFAKTALFYFDITTASSPVFGKGWMPSDGGVTYDVQVPLLVHQWAPVGNQYVPYVDFNAQMSGRIHAQVKDQQMILQMDPGNLSVLPIFRPEFQQLRAVNTRLATGILSSQVKSYLESKPFTFNLPVWSIAGDLQLQIQDVQAWNQSLRIPIDFSPQK